MEVDEPPTGWSLASLGDVITLHRGVTYRKPDARKTAGEGLLPLLRANNIDRVINFDDLVYVPKGLVSEKQRLRPFDIVIAMSSGSKRLVGKAAQTTKALDATFGAFCAAARPLDGMDASFVGWFMQTSEYRQSVSDDSGGSNINNLKREHILGVPFRIPPLPEQKRIVEKIETLFAELDKGEEAVREVQKLLARYRQSVLKAAVTGALTADWRVAHGPAKESGKNLLTRILRTRRDTWQGSGKYKEPVKPNTDDLMDLPHGWAWASIDQILRSDLANGKSVPDAEDGFPVLRLTALKDGVIDLHERKIGAWNAKAAENFLVNQHDVLVSRGNGSKRLVGLGGIVSDDPDGVAYPDTMIRISPLLGFVSADWFVQTWNGPFMRSQIEASAKTTAGIYKINQGDIRSFAIPLPPMSEQQAIATFVEESLAQARVAHGWCETELKRSAALRQSILKDAFSGKLVPQEPSDEPASVLLERLQSKREPNPITGK